MANNSENELVRLLLKVSPAEKQTLAAKSRELGVDVTVFARALLVEWLRVYSDKPVTLGGISATIKLP